MRTSEAATKTPPPTEAPREAAAGPWQVFRQTRFFPSLDGLRAVSIVPVIWHHASASHGYTGILAAGHLGVQLFFAVSGFLITTFLLREKGRTGAVSLARFYARRSLRIFPLYYVVLAVYVLLVLVFDRHSQAGARFFGNLPAYLTYTSNWFVDLNQGNRVIFYFAWSLATEEQFYLLWPSLVRFTRRWWTPLAVMVLLLLGSEAVRALAAGGLADGHALWVRIVSSVASPICLGCIAAILLERPLAFGLIHRVAGRPWSAPVAGALLVLAVALELHMLTIAVAMAFLVTACVIRPDHGLSRVLELRPLRAIGTISYGMYLLHMIVMNVARRVVGLTHLDAPRLEPLLVFALALPLTIAAASLSYRFLEQPFLRLKDRFAS